MSTTPEQKDRKCLIAGAAAAALCITAALAAVTSIIILVIAYPEVILPPIILIVISLTCAAVTGGAGFMILAILGYTAWSLVGERVFLYCMDRRFPPLPTDPDQKQSDTGQIQANAISLTWTTGTGAVALGLAAYAVWSVISHGQAAGMPPTGISALAGAAVGGIAAIAVAFAATVLIIREET